MSYVRLVLFLALLAASALAQPAADDLPRNEKAQKTYKEALDYLHSRMTGAALGVASPINARLA